MGVKLQTEHYNLIGESPSILKVFDLIDRTADSDSTVLLTGESGTGKELMVLSVKLSLSAFYPPMKSRKPLRPPQSRLRVERAQGEFNRKHHQFFTSNGPLFDDAKQVIL